MSRRCRETASATGHTAPLWLAASRRATSRGGPPRRHRQAVRRCATSASVSVCAPPRGITHPTMCAIAPSTRPKPAVRGVSSGSIPCAAMPPKSARVRSSTNVLRAEARSRCEAREARTRPAREDAAASEAGRGPTIRSAATRAPGRRTGVCRARDRGRRPPAVRSTDRSTDRRRAVVKRVRNHGGRLDEFDAVLASGSVRKNGDTAAVACSNT